MVARCRETNHLIQIADCAADQPTSRRSCASPSSNSAAREPCLLVPMLKEERADRRDRYLSPGGAPVHGQADRASEELRRAGRHRHREHAAAQRVAPAHRRSHRIAGAADGDLRGAEGHLQLARRAGAGVQRHAGERDAHLRGQVRNDACEGGSRLSRGRLRGPPPAYVELAERNPSAPRRPTNRLYARVAATRQPATRCRR